MTAMHAIPPASSDLGPTGPSVSGRQGATDRLALERKVGILVGKY
jgi:hypothetical protein